MKIFSKKILLGSFLLLCMLGTTHVLGAMSVGPTVPQESDEGNNESEKANVIPTIASSFIGTSSGKPRYVENEVLLFLKPDSTAVRNANFAVQTFGTLSMEDGEKVFTQSISQAFAADAPNDLTVETNVLFKKEDGVGSFSLSQKGDEEVMVKIKSKSKSAEELLETYKNDANVLSADFNGIRYPTVNYESADYLWHYFNNGSDAGVNANKVWATGVTGQGVVVAVIDTGIDLNHPDLKGQTVTGYDFSGNNDSDPSDEEGHGTHVSGTIAAKKDGSGVVGIAPDAKIMPLKVFGDAGARDSDIFEAINYAVRNGADVINMSLGGCGSCSGSQWQTVLNSVTTAGVTVVVAAGNYGNSAGCADYGISGINPTLTPASCSGIITVGATDFYKKVAPFSSYGSWVDIAAPGAGECSGNDTETCRDNGIASTWPNNQYTRLIGTSMASPHIAGIVALMKSKDPSLTPAKILQIMCDNAEDIDAPGKDAKSGCGFADAEKILAAIDDKLSETISVSPNTQSITVGSDVEQIKISGSASGHTFTLNAGTTGIAKNSCADGATTCTLTAPTATGTATLTLTKGSQTVTATITVTDDDPPPPPPPPGGGKNCSELTSNDEVPEKYGAAYRVFSSTKSLLLKATCNDDTVGFETGNSSEDTYVYKTAYLYSTEDKSWNDFTFDCETEDDSGNWCIGKGTTEFQNDDLEEKNYVAAFTCEWRDNEWKCGCKDSTCSESYWQLQWFQP